MASLISGYEYDIFISYRHNDNLDGWVTGFVQNLEKELKGTIKDSISVYFDTNPHDGLLETHNVDKSLESKLKCLIFIPIISQTYCDPKSFAWQHEFVAFNKLSQEDELGRDIRLSSRNVTSRILPVKIHDLDLTDTNTIENEIGGVLRSIEFIYKEAGVNRPLRSNEEIPSKNQNQTDYRNQINKVANAVKEIITALNNPYTQTSQTSFNNKPPRNVKRSARFSFSLLLILLTLIIAAYFFYPKLFQSDKKEALPDKSIAVLPFINMSNDPDQDYFTNGVMEEILTNLFKIGDLRVTSRTSVMGYKGTNKKVTEIAKELKVSHILEGSVQKNGEEVRITVQLIDAVNDRHLWAEHYDRELKDIFSIQSQVAQQIASSLKAAISPELKQRIEASPTNSTEAYDMVLKGREQIGLYYSKFELSYIYNGIDYLNRAIELDSNYSVAYVGLARAFWVLGQFSPDYGPRHWEESKKYSIKAIKLDPDNGLAYAELAQVQYKWDWDRIAARKSIQKAVELAPGDRSIHEGALYFYQRINDCENLEKERTILATLGNSERSIGDYFSPLCRNNLDQIFALDAKQYGNHRAAILLNQKKYLECIEFTLVDLAISPYNTFNVMALGEAYALSGDPKNAEQTINKLTGLSSVRRVSKCQIAAIYLALGKKEIAYQLFEQSLEEHDMYFHVMKEFSVSVYRIKDDPQFVNIMERSWIPLP